MMLALVAAALLPSVEPPKTDRDGPQPDEVVAAAAFSRAMETREVAAQIVDLDLALANLARPTRYRGMVQCYRGWVLSELKREAESDAAIEECYRLRPDDSYALWEMSSVVLKRRDVRRGARLLVAAIRADPSRLADYDPFAMESTLEQLSYAREDGLRAELLTAMAGTEFGRDDPAWMSGHARDAIDGLLATGDRAGAAGLLPLILVPRLGLELLVDRRYAAIWPDVEAWAGGDLVAQRDSYVATAKAAFNLDPSLHLRRNYASALSAAGRTEEAKALLAEAIVDRSLWDADRFGITMVAIRLAGLLEAEGRRDEAIKLLRDLRAAAPAARFPYVGNVVPNEARLLIASGRPQEALELLDGHDAKDPRAAGITEALRICALRGLGRAAPPPSAALAAEPEAQRYAAGCGAGEAEQKRQWLERLAAPATRGEALLAFVDAERSGRSLAADPEMRAAFERYGRALPASFDGALAAWRAGR